MKPEKPRSEIPQTNLTLSEIEQYVQELLGQIIPEGISPDLTLRQNGLDSMKAARLWLDIESKYQVDIPIEKMANAGLPELAKRIFEKATTALVNPERLSIQTNPNARSEPFPLTPIQESYLMGKQAGLTLDLAGCHQYIEFEVTDIDVNRLCQAWQKLVEHHDMLRTKILPSGRQIVQEQAPEWQLITHNHTNKTPSERDDHIKAIRHRMSQHIYAGGQWPLFNIEVSFVESGTSIVHFSIDSIITDGHGQALLLEQWANCYNEPNVQLTASTLTARDILLSLQSQRGSEAYQNDIKYWLETLKQMPDGPLLPVYLPPGEADTIDYFKRTPLTGMLSASQWRMLKQQANRLDVSSTSLLLTLFANVLAYHQERNPFSLILTTNDRLRLPAEVDHVVGPFTSSAIIIVERKPEDSIDVFCQQVHKKLWQGLEHATVSGVTAVREIRNRDKTHKVIQLPVVFTSMIGTGPNGRQDGGFAANISYAVSQTSDIYLDCQVWEQADELHFRWDVALNLYPKGVIETLFTRFQNALETLCAGYESHQLYPLNALQQAYYVARTLNAVGTWNGCQMYESFDMEEFDHAKLETALLHLINAYVAMRSYLTHEGKLAFIPSTLQKWHIPFIDLTHTQEPLSTISFVREEMSRQAFSLGLWPSFDVRVTYQVGLQATVHCSFDLAVFDAPSIHFLCRELFRFYMDPSAAPKTVTSVTAYLDKQRALQSLPEYAEQREHWKRRFAHIPAGPKLQKSESERKRIRLEGPRINWELLQQKAQKYQVSPDSVLAAIFSETLSRWFEDDFAFTVVRWREDKEVYRPGEFTELSWLQETHRSMSLVEKAALYQQVIDEDMMADAVSGLNELRNRVMQERSRGAFDLPVVYTTIIDVTDNPLPSFVKPGQWLSCTPDVSLDCIAIRDKSELFFCWDVVEQDIPAFMLQQMFDVFKRALHLIVTEEVDWQTVNLHELARPESQTDLPSRSKHSDNGREQDSKQLSAAEYQKIVYEWNDTAVDFPGDRLVYTLFEAYAAKHPDAVAIRSAEGSISYAQLNRDANYIAWYLKSIGVGLETVVGIGTRRCPKMIAAVLGVLKAGGAYLPIDTSWPRERAQLILKQANCSLLLTTSDSPQWEPFDDVETIEIDRDLDNYRGDLEKRASVNPTPIAVPTSLAYIIFTSGSTGAPKGVAIAHRSVSNLLNWCYRMFNFNETDVGLCVTSLAFDLSVFDIFGLLSCGASFYITNETERKDPETLLDILVHEPVTFWNSAPITLSQLSPILPTAAGKAGTNSLRLAFLSGDFTPLSLPDELRQVFQHVKIINLGGATEATVWSNYFCVEEIDPAWHSIPYGKPIDNARYYVLDASLRPCPIGVEGDLFIAGECLSIGYFGQPELTSVCFIPDPFSQKPGEKMYRTGDRAFYLPDGHLSFVGRADNQVKVRGYRVELGEIEHRIREHPAIKDVVVLVQTDRFSDKKIVAYAIPVSTSLPEAKDIRTFAAKTLPEYMVPNFVSYVDFFPSTANGKLDRDALPWPLQNQAAELRTTASMVDALSNEIGRLFSDFLEIEQIKPDEDLWDQGVTSFTVVQVSNALYEKYNVRIAVSAVLAEPTVTAIARYLSESLPASIDHPLQIVSMNDAVQLDSKDQAKKLDSIEFFSLEDQQRFKKSNKNLRSLSPEESLLPLQSIDILNEYYDWRATHRSFLNAQIPHNAFCRFLSLLQKKEFDGKSKYLYPSAGDTYAVQVYLNIKNDAVEGVPEGLYYYRPNEHCLQQISRQSYANRANHFYYNRPIFDRAGFEIYLVGQLDGIEPLYKEYSKPFLLLEAGYIGQTLMMGQAGCGIGLCPVGHITFEHLRSQLKLNDSHVFLHSFIGGRVPEPQKIVPTSEIAVNGQHHTRQPVNDIAIVGLAGQYPGADTPYDLWRNLRSGISSVGPIPSKRQPDLQQWFTNSNHHGAEVSGGFLSDIEHFDSLLFHISPQEAKTLDPQLRLLLQNVWACLENAGYSPDLLQRKNYRVGVFVGVMWYDYQQVGADIAEYSGSTQITSSASDIANRISHFFNFQGPSIAVDTSCSSALTAVHLASESLKRKECDLALVGTVNLVAHPHHMRLLSGLNLISNKKPAGAFDGNSSGWSVGEGVGAILLRPLASATANHDIVHGIIENTWISHAGSGNRFGVPNTAAIIDSLQQTLATGKCHPSDISYVETAVSGASLSDVAEIEALSAVFAATERTVPLLVGTLKPNIGHQEAAAGLSQLTKVLLQLKHRQIPPTLLSEQRSSLLPWDKLPLKFVQQLTDWTPSSTEKPLRALINAVGATGSYAHVVVRSLLNEDEQMNPDIHVSPEPQVIILSAESEEQLGIIARNLFDHITSLLGRNIPVRLADIAHTLQTGRTQLTQRLAIICHDVENLLHLLSQFIQGKPASGLYLGQTNARQLAAAPEPATSQEAVALWLAGQHIKWETFWSDEAHRIELPTYPFAKEAYWADPAASRTEEPVLVEKEVPMVTDQTQVEEYLKRIYANISGIPINKLDAWQHLESYGLNSFLVANLNSQLEKDFKNRSIPKTIFFEYATLAQIAEYLHQHIPNIDDCLAQALNLSDVPSQTETLRLSSQAAAAHMIQKSTPITHHTRVPDDDMAIVGIAGRYPQATNLKEFWQLLKNGRDCVTPWPASRQQAGWPTDDMWGSFLEDVDCFDALFFNIAPRDADFMDPQERLFLEVVWETLENANCTQETLKNSYDSNVGVFVGSMYNDYPFFGVEQFVHGQLVSAGSSIADIANRVSYFFDLHGPSLTVDTMCSSSLTAIHLAVESLKRGECKAAIAGGVNLSLHPNKFIEQQRLHMTSKTHRCRSFGAGGDGFVPGEGVGAILLKPLQAAIADGDQIHAVIKSTAVNHGGRTNGYTVPNPASQAELLNQAILRAGISPETVTYIEAHGTGTELGDPIEIEGLKRVFANKKRTIPCAVGSIKSNIGHLEGAAGIASLTKVVLQMKHNCLVPTLHSQEINPNIDLQQTPFFFPQTVTEWPSPENAADLPKRAGISSFGAGGANAHIILESFEPMSSIHTSPIVFAQRPQLIVLSAMNEERLKALAAKLAIHIDTLNQASSAKNTSSISQFYLEDVAYTLQKGRESLQERLAFVCFDLQELHETLRSFSNGTFTKGLRGRVAKHNRPSAVELPDSLLLSETALMEIGQQWVNGKQINWEPLHPDRKPKLVELPSYPFIKNRHWLPQMQNHQQILKGLPPNNSPSKVLRTDTQTVNPGSNHFVLLKKEWALPNAQAKSLFSPTGALVCLFHEGSEPVANELVNQFGPDHILLLREGANKLDGIPSYHDTNSAEEAIHMLLSEAKNQVSGWIDLCDLYTHNEYTLFWAERLIILQSIIKEFRYAGLKSLHVTQGLHEVAGPSPSLVGAQIAGLMRTLTSEYPTVVSKTVDTDLPVARSKSVAEQLISEWCITDEYTEICYREGLRYCPHIVETIPQNAPQSFDSNKVYIVTGGLRGIGALVARYLADNGVRKLLLMNTRALPPRSQWDKPNLPKYETDAISHIKELESRGVQVLIYSGKLTDQFKLATFLEQARVSLGEIDGVIHCAGHISNTHTAFINKDLTQINDVFEPKVQGLMMLTQLLASDNLSFFVLFSSIASVIPQLGAGISDYAAANTFMNFFANYQNRRGKHYFKSIAWPSWTNFGMNKGESELYNKMGLGSISNEMGLKILEDTLSSANTGCLIPCPVAYGFASPETLFNNTKQSMPVANTGAESIPSLNKNGNHTLNGQTYASEPIVADYSMQWLTDIFVDTLGIQEKHLDPQALFGDLGVESVMLGDLLRKIEAYLEQPLEPSLLFNNPTLHQLTAHIQRDYLSQKSEKIASEPVNFHLHDNLAAPNTFNTSNPNNTKDLKGKQIAVIGMACRFPGAENVSAFWANLKNGQCAITEVPSSRWDHKKLYQSTYQVGKSISKWGGFLEHIEYFDPQRFNMTDEEATCLDPATRLTLENTLACLADAGYDEQELWGHDVGVFIGTRISDYGKRIGIRPGNVTFGSDQNFIAAYIAHQFNFTGPNMVVDTACSSSVVSIQLAIRSLLEGESEIAIAGGVDILLNEKPYLEFSAMQALSPSGKCYAFDERANGMVPGEGCGVILLKPLEQALQDGDQIHCVIDAVAVGNDGRTMGLTTPNPHAQAKVIKKALQLSGYAAEDIGMIEAHGTGTMIGDPIELRALTEVYRESTNKSGYCAIGSVKSNLGHLLSAAGIAGFIKVALALEHGQIPSTLFCEAPNPRFDFKQSPFYPVTTLKSWSPGSGLRIAGLSSFGLGGTNAHLIASELNPKLREAYPKQRTPFPAPTFVRKRLWLDSLTNSVQPCEVPGNGAKRANEQFVASILDLHFNES